MSRDIDEMLMAGLNPINFSNDPREDPADGRDEYKLSGDSDTGRHQ